MDLLADIRQQRATMTQEEKATIALELAMDIVKIKELLRQVENKFEKFLKTEVAPKPIEGVIG